jgi:hypothetical protein
MKNTNISWKGSIHILGTDYQWEQCATPHPQIIKVKVLAPLKFTFEFEPQQTSFAEAIVKQINLLNNSH